MLKIAWKDQTIGRSLSLSRTVTLWRWCSKGVKMGQQAIVGSIQGNVNRTLLKSHTKKNLKEHIFKLGKYGGVGEENTKYWCNLIEGWRLKSSSTNGQMVNSSLSMAVLSNMHPKYGTDKRDTGLQAKVKTTETLRETWNFPMTFSSVYFQLPQLFCRNHCILHS